MWSITTKHNYRNNNTVQAKMGRVHSFCHLKPPFFKDQKLCQNEPKSLNQVDMKFNYVVFEGMVSKIHLEVLHFIVISLFEYGTKFQLWTIPDTNICSIPIT